MAWRNRGVLLKERVILAGCLLAVPAFASQAISGSVREITPDESAGLGDPDGSGYRKSVV